MLLVLIWFVKMVGNWKANHKQKSEIKDWVFKDVVKSAPHHLTLY